MKILLLKILVVLLVLVTTTTVAAHAGLVKSEPEDGQVLETSPARVTATFSEELDSELSKIRVFDDQNNQVDNGDGSVDLNDLDHLTMEVSLPPLPAGTYRVDWTSVSAEDGDAEEGEFTFRVGSEDALIGPSTSSANVSSIWILGGVTSFLAFIVFLWIGFNRRRTHLN